MGLAVVCALLSAVPVLLSFQVKLLYTCNTELRGTSNVDRHHDASDVGSRLLPDLLRPTRPSQLDTSSGGAGS